MTKVLSQRHVLAVRDLAATRRYYMEVLGFAEDMEVEGWAFLSLGDFRVMIGECSDDMTAAETNNHSYYAHVVVDDVDALFAGFTGRGADILSQPTDKPWGLREGTLRTPEGHRICFATSLD